VQAIAGGSGACRPQQVMRVTHLDVEPQNRRGYRAAAFHQYEHAAGSREPTAGRIQTRTFPMRTRPAHTALEQRLLAFRQIDHCRLHVTPRAGLAASRSIRPGRMRSRASIVRRTRFQRAICNANLAASLESQREYTSRECCCARRAQSSGYGCGRGRSVGTKNR